MTSIAQDLAPMLVALLVASAILGGFYFGQRARAQTGDQDTRDKPQRFLATVRHVHVLDAESAGLVGELVKGAIADYFDHAVNQPLGPQASKTIVPPEPEERMARDLVKAKAIMRGAEQLQAAARAAGKYLSDSDALREAATMAANAFDDTN